MVRSGSGFIVNLVVLLLGYLKLAEPNTSNESFFILILTLFFKLESIYDGLF